MPLKLQAPRQGKSPNWTIRGTYLKVRVDQSSGTHRRPVALAELRKIEAAIERGEYPAPRPQAGEQQPTFLSAAVAYMEAGRRRRYVAKLIKYFGDTPLTKIDQAAIDAAAITICPNVKPATRNTCVYTPVSAILRHAGVDLKLKRPHGAKGRVVTDWLPAGDADGIISAADNFDREFALLLRFLLYTGLRLSEALALRWDDVRLDESVAWVRRKKGGIASDVRLRSDLCHDMRSHCPQEPRGRVFRFHQGGWLKHLLTRSKLAFLGLPCPDRRPVGWRPPMNRLGWVNFHTFRHTWATWMRRAGADVQGLVATGNWRDARSAGRYAHAIAREEWARVEDLPTIKRTA
jgi:integrase